MTKTTVILDSKGIDISRLRSASWPGLLAMGLSLLCALAYAWTQIPEKEGFAGEVEKQWRDGRLYPIESGPIKFLSGDLVGNGVTDPQFGLVLPSAVLFRKVQSFQYIETCKNTSDCSVSMGWSDSYVNGDKFKNKGYVNQQPPNSLMFASRVTVGKKGISSRAISKLSFMAVPYPVGVNNNDVPGFLKIDGAYQNFQGEPKLGSIKITYKHIPLGVGVSMVGELDERGDLTVGPNGRFLAKQGSMKPQDLLGLEFWQLPRFGFALLAMCAMLFIAGVFGVWSSNKIERQIRRARISGVNDNCKRRANRPKCRYRHRLRSGTAKSQWQNST